jgi:hypothetical protein
MKSIAETVVLPEYGIIFAGIVGLFSIVFYLFANYDRKRTEGLTKVRLAYQAERKSLIQIFEALNGEAWFDKTGWLSSLPLSKWKGVKLDPYTKRVNKLILPSNRLAGKSQVLNMHFHSFLRPPMNPFNLLQLSFSLV